ncbi:hypothetical protein tb265_07070 [Gemmatimonadetes bacterium T265]|nr:hypothetical protein tb265_07070 [Gemmatimonadetes bacterium T265]
MHKVKAALRERLPRQWRYERDAAAIRRLYAPRIAAARAARDLDEINALLASRDHELSLLAEEAEADFTMSLVREARRLRVPVPPRADDGEPVATPPA